MRLVDQTLSLTQEEIDLVLRVADGNKQAIIFVYHMREICRRAQQLDYLQILDYLCRHRITGNRFLEWVLVEHNKALVKAVAEIRMKIHKDYTLKKVIAKGYNGRD